MAKNKKAKKNAFDSILNVFAWLSFFVAVILALAVFLSSYSGVDNGRSIFGYKMLIVGSDSMSKSELSVDEPISFKKDDLIFIKKVDDVKEIKVGDVITFISCNPGSNGKTVSHKVRSIKTTASGDILGFETYGINTGVSDEAIVDPSTIIGKYVGKSQILGNLFCFFKTPAGYFTSILIPCVLLIIFFSIKVGELLNRRHMHRTYYDEFENLKNKINDLENNKGAVVYMQPELQTSEKLLATGDAVLVVKDEVENINEEVSIVTDEVQSQEVEVQNQTTEQEVEVEVQPTASVQSAPSVQPIIQMQNANGKVLEIMANTLSKAVDALTHTIDTLASSVGKPVDSLTRSIEILASANATANATPTVVEKVIEKPIIQTVEKEVIKEVPVEVIKEVQVEVIKEVPVEVIKEVPVEVIKEVPAQVVEETAVTEEVETEEVAGSIFDGFKQHDKVPFNKKLLSLDKDIKEYFSDIHNELISFKKVNYRISFKGITYRVGRKALAKMVVRGKTLKLHLALGIEDYPTTVFFQQDMGGVKAYEDVPFTVKVKSERGRNNAIKLVNSLAENNLLKKNEQFVKENILKQLRAINQIKKA